MSMQPQSGAVRLERRSRLENLERLAAFLNAPRRGSPEVKGVISCERGFFRAAQLVANQLAQAWSIHEKGGIREALVPRSTLVRFNELARQPIQISLSYESPFGGVVPRWKSWRDLLVFELMQLFWNPDAPRLKRCARKDCGIWF